MVRFGTDIVSLGVAEAAATVVIAGAGTAAAGAAEVTGVAASWPAQRQRPRASARLPVPTDTRRCRPELSSRTVENPSGTPARLAVGFGRESCPAARWRLHPKVLAVACPATVERTADGSPVPATRCLCVLVP